MKAAGYFNIKIITIPVDPVTYKVDVKAMARAITRNTVMVRKRERGVTPMDYAFLCLTG
jgi:glutamate/tyrosine decarboxylase-like PLP-dependent enzyme